MCATVKDKVDKEVQISSYDIDAPEDVVRCLAHWIEERDATAAIDATRPADKKWPEFFFNVYCSVLPICGLKIQDALSDCFIDWFRKEMSLAAKPTLLFWEVYGEYKSQSEDLPTYEGRMDELFAVLALYQDSTLQDDWSAEYGRLAQPVIDGAMRLFWNAWNAKNLSTIPKNPLNADFRDYCQYHCLFRCYRTNQNHLGCEEV